MSEKQKLRILLIGDLHIQPSTVPDFRKFKEEFFEKLEELKPDLVIQLGDILHTHQTVHITCLCEAVEFLQEVVRRKYRMILLIGNHDRLNNSDFQSDFHAFTAIKNTEDTQLIIVNKTREVFIMGHRLICAPYVSPGRFMEALSTVDNPLQGTSCFFAHQEFLHAKMGIIESEHGDPWDVSYPPCYSGHVHDFDQLQSNLVYTGTPYMTSFGELDGKGLMLLTIEESGEYTHQRIPLSVSNSKKKIHWTTKDILERKKVPVEFEKYQIKIIINGLNTEKKAICSNNYYKELSKKYKISYKGIRNRGKDQKDKKDLSFYKNKTFSELMNEQLITDMTDKIKINFHQKIINGELPE